MQPADVVALYQGLLTRDGSTRRGSPFFPKHAARVEALARSARLKG